MKKIVITILVLVLIGAGVGAFFWGRSLSDRDADKGTAKSNTTYRVDYLQDSYVKGSLIIFAVTATSDVKYTSMSYSLNNGEQTLFVVKTGESKDLENKIGKGKYYIKSDATTIATNNLNTGWYTLEILYVTFNSKYNIPDYQSDALRVSGKRRGFRRGRRRYGVLI